MFVVVVVMGPRGVVELLRKQLMTRIIWYRRTLKEDIHTYKHSRCMTLPNLSRLFAPTAGMRESSRAVAEELVRNEQGPWSEIKAALDTRELTFNVNITAVDNWFTILMHHSNAYNAETATSEMRRLVEAVQTTAVLPRLATDAADAFEDMTRWCRDHITFPEGEQPADVTDLFNQNPRLETDILMFKLTEEAMKWFTTFKETRVLNFFVMSLAARIAHNLRITYNLSYVVQTRISEPAELRYLQQQVADVQKDRAIDLMPTQEEFRVASTAAPDAASYARFSVHPFSRVAKTRPVLLCNGTFVGFKLRFRPLAMVRGVSKAGREVGQ